MPSSHRAVDRVLEFHNRRIEHIDGLTAIEKYVVERMEEELVLEAWRKGFYFDRRPAMTKQPWECDPASSEPIEYIEIHLQALGLALPFPEEDRTE